MGSEHPGGTNGAREVEYDVAPELARIYAIEDCERFIDEYNALVREWRTAAEVPGPADGARRLAELLESFWPPPDAVARTARLLDDRRRLVIEPLSAKAARAAAVADPPAAAPTSTRPPATPSARHRERAAHALEWARRQFDITEPHALEALGINVLFAPMLPHGVKMVDLSDGRVDTLQRGEHAPSSGYYAEYGSLERYCYRRGLSLHETGGRVNLLPSGRGHAGDPLRHEGR
jgi:hypothetical protein